MNCINIVRQFAFLPILIAIQISASAQQGYQIKGRVIDFEQNTTAYMYTFDNGRSILDSTTVKNGSFIFKGSVSHPMIVSIQVKSIRRGFDLILENESYDIQMVTNWEDANKSTGGKEMAIQKAYEAETAKLQEQLMEVSKRYGQLPNEERLKESGELSKLNDKLMKIKLKFIQTHPASLAMLQIMRPQFDVMNFKELEKMVTLFSPELAYSNIYTRLKELYEQKKAAFLVGKQAPDFTLPDMQEKPFTLSSLQGKYVLVDFWASWCTPCRTANLQLKPLYEQYKGKEFEIVSISMDDKRNLWEEAVKKDGIPWLHVSELAGMRASLVTANYGVRSLPTVFLLDKTGKVIAQNISKKELMMILEDTLGK